MRRLGIILLLPLFFLSCGGDYGKHVQGENVTVYYTEGVQTAEAVKLLEFWVNRPLIGKERQYIQLTKIKEVYQVKLIPSDSMLLSELPFDYIVPLLELESELASVVFAGNPCKLVLSDPQFRQSISITGD